MTKIMCGAIACLHNSSNIYETYGECKLDEVKMDDREILDGEQIPPNWEDFVECKGFEFHVGKVLVREKPKTIRIKTRGDE